MAEIVKSLSVSSQRLLHRPPSNSAAKAAYTTATAVRDLHPIDWISVGGNQRPAANAAFTMPVLCHIYHPINPIMVDGSRRARRQAKLSQDRPCDAGWRYPDQQCYINRHLQGFTRSV
ncbi:hypothetical protein VPH35_077890 [Triticum aestivum]|uniref:Uncharacterized protein n=1 Tax=Aegilops tauschii TaxID=37682 RepID=N1QV31_AEGTA